MLDYKKLIERGHNWINNNFIPELNMSNGIIAEMSAAIEALLAERDTAEWVSVKDKLPCEGTRVLVYHNDAVIRLGRVMYGEFDSVLNLDLQKTDVTHWMLLPKPPRDD